MAMPSDFRQWSLSKQCFIIVYYCYDDGINNFMSESIKCSSQKQNTCRASFVSLNNSCSNPKNNSKSVVHIPGKQPNCIAILNATYFLAYIQYSYHKITQKFNYWYFNILTSYALFGLSGCGVSPFPSRFSTTFLNIVVEVMTLGLPQVCKLWLGVSKGLLHAYI